MPLYRWATFQDLLSLQDRMNQILEEAIRRVGLTPEERSPGQWKPACDMFETSEAIHLMVELPGVPRDGIDVEVVGDRIVIRGERPIPENTSKEAFVRMERSYGPFRREFLLPDDVDAEGIRAEFEAGVLSVVVPRMGASSRSVVVRSSNEDEA